LLQDVLHLLDRLQEAAEANARMSSVLEILILRALVLEVQGNRTAGLSVLERALVLAEPEVYMRLFVDEGTPMLTLLCPACSARDGRRAAALIDQAAYRDLTLERIVRECGVCDAHGFLVTAKNAASDGSREARQRLSKHSLVEFSFALALPGRHAETVQLFTRAGDSKEEGQMLMKMTVRSGEYAICVRYKCAGVGLDTEKWRVALDDEQERRTRHRAILAALSDSLLSPQGALTATMLPHLTGLRGAIAVRTRTGRAPLYSALQEDFVERLTAIASGACAVYPFETVDAFHTHMQALIETSYPSMPAACSVSTQAPG
jgi:MalT-like TPR region/CRISPR-associated negative auto-regulator DevR/Csa2